MFYRLRTTLQHICDHPVFHICQYTEARSLRGSGESREGRACAPVGFDDVANVVFERNAVMLQCETVRLVSVSCSTIHYSNRLLLIDYRV